MSAPSYVLFLTTNRYGELPGGIERFLMVTTAWLEKKGITPLVVHPSATSVKLVRVSGSISRPSSSRQGTRVVSLPLTVHMIVMPLLAAMCAIVATRIGRRTPVKIVHGQDASFGGLASIATAHLLRVPVVLHSHGPQVYLIADRPGFWAIETLVNKVCGRLADLLIVTDQLSRRYFENLDVDPSKILKLPNPRPPISGLKDHQEHPFTITYLGRIDPEKNLPVLMEAFHMLDTQIDSQTRLLIVGAGPRLGRIQKLAKQLGKEHSVHFLGSRWDIEEVFSETDVLVLPSLVEGSPLVLLEAAAAGIPVVASDIPAVREIITHQRTGLLVPPSSPEAFSAAIISIFENRSEADAMAKRAKRRVMKNHDPNKILSRLVHTYQRVIRERQRRTK